jgi:Ras-related GTP-binding protein A/B
MRSIIFNNHVAQDTRRLGATIDVEASQIRFLGEMRLDLWDCGGQESE